MPHIDVERDRQYMGRATASPFKKLSLVRAFWHDNRGGKHRPNPYIRLLMMLVCAFGLTGGVYIFLWERFVEGARMPHLPDRRK